MKKQAVFVLILLIGMSAITISGGSLEAFETNMDGQQQGLSIGTSSPSEMPNGEDEQEEIIPFREVPDPVKATILTELLREVDELTLIHIERETEEGNIVYEAEFQYKNKNIELEITPEGEFLEKEVKRHVHQGN